MKNYLLFLCTMSILFGFAQTTNLAHRQANYTIVADGGGAFDDGTDNLGMWANQGNKQILVFRGFDDAGDGTGNAITANTGDSFKITLNAKRAYGEIGVALLNNPAATAAWADRKNNYVAYAIMSGPNGEESAWSSWKAHSVDGGSETFTVSGDANNFTDFVITFTISASDNITVDINGESKVLNVTSPDFTHFSVWLYDDYSGAANSNIYLKPTTEIIQATLSNSNLVNSKNSLVSSLFTERVVFAQPFKQHMTWALYDLTGKNIQRGEAKKYEREISLNPPSKGIYILKIGTVQSKKNEVFKLIRN